MGFLNRNSQGPRVGKPNDATTIVQREIEITVEREWTTLRAHPQPVTAEQVVPVPLAKLE